MMTFSCCDCNAYSFVAYLPICVTLVCLCEGILPLAVAFLDQSRTEAHCAFAMLFYLCSEEVDVDLAHSKLVARLQGVRRLSHIFCPEVPASRDVGRQAAGTATNPSCCECCVKHELQVRCQRIRAASRCKPFCRAESGDAAEVDVLVIWLHLGVITNSMRQQGRVVFQVLA